MKVAYIVPLLLMAIILGLGGAVVFAQGEEPEQPLVKQTTTPSPKLIQRALLSVICILHNNLGTVALLVFIGSFLAYAVRGFLQYLAGARMGGFEMGVREGLISGIIAGGLLLVAEPLLVWLFRLWGYEIDFSVCSAI